MKTIIHMCLAVFLFTLSACENRLDIRQHGATSSDNFYKNDQECWEGLATVYSYLEKNWIQQDYPVANMLSDDVYAGGGTRGDNVGYEEINEFRHTTANVQIKETFEAYYYTVYRCNLLINSVEQNVESTNIMKRCAAEARVIRAFSYLRLASIFGECPLIIELITDGNYARPESSLSEIYAQIEQDLQDAINSGLLVEKEEVNSKMAHVTKQTAEAILGKAYVYESTFLNVDKWQEARNAFNSVISSGKYKLYEGDYINQFHNDEEFSCESLFETNRVSDSQNLNRVMVHSRLGWRVEKFKTDQFLATQASGKTECADGNAYGFFNPTKELYNAFVEMEGEDGYRLNQVIISYKKLSEMPLQIATGNFMYGNIGYFQKKMMPKTKEFVASHRFSMNYVLMRYAEVLLLAAEAELPQHGGSQTNVDKYINQIKDRARIAHKPGSYTLLDIEKEKRLELCYEGVRYPDLVRWGRAEELLKEKGKKVPILYGLADGRDNNNEIYTEIDGYNINWYETGSNGWQSKHRFMPIPQTELDVNQLISQHPEWQ